MRKRILVTLVAPLGLAAALALPPRNPASAENAGQVVPLRALALVAARLETTTTTNAAESEAEAVTADQGVTDDGSAEILASTLAVLPLEEARELHAETEVVLRLARTEKASDDRRVAAARGAVDELHDETETIAERTVANAIANYRRFDFDPAVPAVSDLNDEFRARSLGEAALVADTDTFDRYYDKTKDLQIAQYQLLAVEHENQRLAATVDELERRHRAEQVAMVGLEERALWDTVYEDWTSESLWLQQLGTKQGAYFLTCPVDGPHEFIDSWGFPRSGGRRHKGVDILAPTGTPIVAPVSGRVEFRSNRVGGRSFHLYDENGNYFYGTHLSAYGDTEGEVRAGQVIGYVGDDGNAAGIPHLHLEIHPGGRGNPINPFPDSAAVCDGVIYR